MRSVTDDRCDRKSKFLIIPRAFIFVHGRPHTSLYSDLGDFPGGSAVRV